MYSIRPLSIHIVVILDEPVKGRLASKLCHEGSEDVGELEDDVTERITVGQLFETPTRKGPTCVKQLFLRP
jgi:hypothetical protein